MSLTEREVQLLEAFTWLATVHHQVQHKAIDPPPTFENCEARTCKYAHGIIVRSRDVVQ